MARDFNGTDSGDRISLGDPATLQFGTGDFAVSLWFHADVVSYGAADQGTLISKSFTGFEVFVYQAKLNAYIGGTAHQATGASTLSTGTWYHACLSRTGAAVTLYLNGASEATATNSASATNSGVNVNLGGRTADNTLMFNGRLAEVAAWKGVGLAAGQVAALARGISPAAVLKGAHYWPLLGRASPEADVWGGQGGTLTGTTTADHPRVYRPGKRRSVFVPGVVAPAEGSGTVTGVGSASGAGSATHSGSGAVGGVGSVAGTGASARSGAGTITGVGSATGTGAAVHGGAGSVAGIGSAAGAGASARSGSGTVGGVGSAAGAGYVTRSGSGTVTGIGGVVGAGPVPATTPGGVFRRPLWSWPRVFARAARSWPRVFARSRPTWPRVWRYQPVSTAMPVTELTKTESDDREFAFDLSKCPEVAGGATFSSAEMVGGSGLSFGSPAATTAEFDEIAAGKAVKVRIHGGSDGSTYDFACKVTLSTGRVVVIPARLVVTGDHE